MKRYTDLHIQKRYSKNTMNTYCNYFKYFLSFFKAERIKDVTTSQINSYILEMIKSRNISISQQNQ